ncbi:hypothetical protein GJAV_G00156950 [Gymnothorax javanicus]|nr:hypothetical protein GJAV_G00156950 [Gymnothorax javanicus]
MSLFQSTPVDLKGSYTETYFCHVGFSHLLSRKRNLDSQSLDRNLIANLLLPMQMEMINDEELSEEEDEVEYYSLYDQPFPETRIVHAVDRQSSRNPQQDTRLQEPDAEESPETDAPMEAEPDPERQEPRVEFDESALNPEAPAFEPASAGDDGNSETGQIQHSRTPGNNPSAPGRVEATDVRSSSVTLCWERPVSVEGVPHEIHITYSCEGEEPRLQKCAPNTTIAVLSDLRPGMEYTFNITTVLPNGSCSETSSACVRTLTGSSLDELSDLGLEQRLKNKLEIREDMFRLESIKKNHFAVMEQNVLKLIEKSRKSKDLTEEQLGAEFERMWADTVVQLKLYGLEKRDVVQDIHHQLRANLGREGSSVQEMLSKVRNLSKCGTEPFEVKSKDRRMFTKVWHTIFRDEHQLKTQNMADHIIKHSRQFVDEKVRTRSDYHSTYMAELLHMIDVNLEQDRDLELTAELKAEVKINICGHAVREIQKMHLEFICANDPHHCLEQLKEQFCADFKDLFHERNQCQKKAEEFTYNCLAPAVKEYITQSLGPDLVDEVLTGKRTTDFSTRTFFQFSLLKQLLEDDHFQDFVNYINNYQSFVQERIIEQIVQLFSEGGSLMIYEIKHLKLIVHRIKTAVKDAQMQVKAEEDQNIQQFILDICRDLQKELIIPTDPPRAVLALNMAKPGDFSECLIKLADEMEQHLTAEFQRGGDVRSRLTSLPFKPQEELFNRVFGCGQQCPFCRTPCEAGVQKHTEHFASIHRPHGMWGVRNLHSGKLEINICTSSVASEENFKVSETGHKWHPYKDYKSIYPDWRTQPDTSIEASDYWKYVFSRFNQQLAEEYKTEPADIPLSWKLVTKDQVMESLRKSFQMKTED